MQTSKIKSITEIPNSESYVYDLEIPSIHAFFANGILVHNTDSIFITFDSLLRSIYGDKYEDVDTDTKIGKVIELNEKVAKYINEVLVPDMLNRHNTSPIDSMASKFNFNLKQELVIQRCVFFKTKKKYAIWVVRKEGKVTDKVNSAGLEIVRSDYPKFTRNMMKSFIDLILKIGTNKNQVAIKVDDYKEEYRKLLLEGNTEAAIPGAWNKENYSYRIDEIGNVENGTHQVKKIQQFPRSVKAMKIYNAIYGNTFKVMDKGYRFDIEPVNPSNFNSEIESNLNALISEGVLGKEGLIDCIMIPDGKKLDTKIFTPNIEKMTNFSVVERLDSICKLYGVEVKDIDNIGI